MWAAICNLTSKKLQIQQHLFSNHYWSERWYWVNAHVEFQRRILWTRRWSTLSFLPGVDVEDSSSFVTQFGHPCWNSKKPTLGDTFWVSRSSWAELAHPPRPWSCFHFGIIGLRGKQGWSLWQGHQSHLKGNALALVNLFLHPRHGCFNTPIEELMIIATIYWALSICQTQTSTSWKSCTFNTFNIPTADNEGTDSRGLRICPKSESDFYLLSFYFSTLKIPCIWKLNVYF